MRNTPPVTQDPQEDLAVANCYHRLREVNNRLKSAQCVSAIINLHATRNSLERRTLIQPIGTPLLHTNNILVVFLFFTYILKIPIDAFDEFHIKILKSKNSSLMEHFNWSIVFEADCTYIRKQIKWRTC